MKTWFWFSLLSTARHFHGRPRVHCRPRGQVRLLAPRWRSLTGDSIHGKQRRTSICFAIHWLVRCGFGTREQLTSLARQNFTTNRPRRRCLSDGHGLVALGLAARAKRRCLNLFNDIRARGMDDDGPARRPATRHDQFVTWSSLSDQRWSISGGRRGCGIRCGVFVLQGLNKMIAGSFVLKK